jgi:hypothetical protein
MAVCRGAGYCDRGHRSWVLNDFAASSVAGVRSDSTLRQVAKQVRFGKLVGGASPFVIAPRNSAD